MKIALGLEYDGRRFCGWQYQKHAVSIQLHVERALGRVADHPLRVHCAGRTDAGVHAVGQIVHFESDAARDERAWVFGVNTYLPGDLSVLWARGVTDDFHARFSATARAYRYLILNRPARPGLLAARATWERRALDEVPMQEAARHLIGEHDFSAYRAQGCQARSPIREVRRLDVVRHGVFLCIDIEANAFLHHMVRNIVGVLMAIGRGAASPIWAKQVLEGRARARGGVTAPPEGLYLTAVRYPERYALPDAPAWTWPV
ncbi:MAG: tRNA pseudouridine(38-40) synthase TruA [Gammaproteobacteria bacterium]